MKQVKAYKITMEQLLSNSTEGSSFVYVTPVSATLLSFNTGTLCKDASGQLYLCQMGEWFRNGSNALPQIEEFDQLCALGLTQLKKEKVTIQPPIDEETGELPSKKEVEILTVKEKPKKKK